MAWIVAGFQVGPGRVGGQRREEKLENSFFSADVLRYSI